jgi:homoserine kinase type II
VLPFLDPDAAALLKEEVRFQSLYRFEDLPRGVIHADLFRDNVLWDGARVGGIIDFYFACRDVLLYDVAIAVNDWCIAADATLDPQRARALLEAYQRVRASTEVGVVPGRRCCAAALRFWVSGYLTCICRVRARSCTPGPAAFRRILEQHAAHESRRANSLLRTYEYSNR